jgi:TRAP-type C4-dicarboxylate transport system substrate-binding protein
LGRRSIGAVAVLGLAVTLAGCGGTQPPAVADKAGSQTLFLKIAASDGTLQKDLPPGPKEFLDSLASLSVDRIQVDYSLNYAGGGADSETKIVEAIAKGELDAGFPSVRAFPNAGIRGLEGIEAPMIITSYAAEKNLVSGPVSADALAQLNGTGLVGLALAVGPLRRPFAAKAPLLGPDSWQGVTFRSFNSPVQDETIRALGANPMDLGSDWTDAIATGELRGAESDIPEYAARGFTTEAPFVTANVVLWPKVFVLAVSQKLWDTLNDQQKAWVQQAAAIGTKASLEAAFDESTTARVLCDEGVSFVDASPVQLADLHAAVAPVISDLAANAVTAPLLAKVQGIAARYVQTDVPDVPPTCQTVASPRPNSSVPPDVSKLPAGIYRVQITPADVGAAGRSNQNGLSGTWTTTVYPDGTYAASCEAASEPGIDCGNIPANTPQIVEAGLLRGTGNTVYFVPDGPTEQRRQGCLMPPTTAPDHCFVGPPYWVDWALSGNTLTFTNRGGMDPSVDSLSIKPWTKIG